MAEETLKGVFRTKKTDASGKSVLRYWLAWDRDDGNVAVQPLNSNMVPAGQKRVISSEAFLETFESEKDVFVDPATAKVRRIWKAELDMDDDLKTGPVTDRFRKPAAPPGAPPDVEKSARAEFGIALTYLKRGYREKAKQHFEALAKEKGNFEPQHKHMFNDFGIGLRKSRMYDTALKHYQRALELSPDDDHLLHNMARAYYEQGNMGAAAQNLEKSLALNPRLKESRLFLEFINNKWTPLGLMDEEEAEDTEH
jgi:tetratricopeptide (TPR) repeat protein